MSTANTVTSLNGNFKKLYAPNLVSIIPNVSKIWQEIEMIPAEKMGGLDYNVPVVLANEHGKL